MNFPHSTETWATRTDFYTSYLSLSESIFVHAKHNILGKATAALFRERNTQCYTYHLLRKFSNYWGSTQMFFALEKFPNFCLYSHFLESQNIVQKIKSKKCDYFQLRSFPCYELGRHNSEALEICQLTYKWWSRRMECLPWFEILRLLYWDTEW